MSIIKKVAILGGDLSGLTPQERGDYYVEVCDSVGVNPLTEPFKYITLNGKLQLYATRACAEQLRKVHSISLSLSEGKEIGDAYVVKAKASMPNGRCDESTGAVNLTGLKGEAFSNALLKAETKAKRRVTLSICGLGYLDETEVEDIPGVVLEPTPETPDPKSTPKHNPPKATEPPAAPPETPPAAKEEKKKKPSSKKKSPTTTATVVVMEEPVPKEKGYELKVLITEPAKTAEAQGHKPLTLITPESYEEGQALVVRGTIEGDKFIAESVAPVTSSEVPETVRLLADPKSTTFEVNGQEQKLPWAYVEARDGGEYAIVGECVVAFKNGDTLEVVVASEQTKGTGTLLFVEKAAQVAQAS